MTTFQSIKLSNTVHVHTAHRVDSVKKAFNIQFVFANSNFQKKLKYVIPPTYIYCPIRFKNICKMHGPTFFYLRTTSLIRKYLNCLKKKKIAIRWIA